MTDNASDVPAALVTEVAAVVGADPEDLPALYERIDPEALEQFVEGTRNGAVSFEYAGCEVRLDSDGAIRIDGGPIADVSNETTD